MSTTGYGVQPWRPPVEPDRQHTPIPEGGSMSGLAASVLEEGAGIFTCPECEEAGIARAFETAQALGTHRYQSHSVRGESHRAKLREDQKKQVKKAKDSKPLKRRGDPEKGARVPTRPTPKRRDTSMEIREPEGLSPREFSAFRLGVLNTILYGIDSGELEAPAEIFLSAFKSELAYHGKMLAVTVQSAPAA